MLPFPVIGVACRDLRLDFDDAREIRGGQSDVNAARRRRAAFKRPQSKDFQPRVQRAARAERPASVSPEKSEELTS
jgi:hypothetical protein